MAETLSARDRLIARLAKVPFIDRESAEGAVGELEDTVQRKVAPLVIGSIAVSGLALFVALRAGRKSKGLSGSDRGAGRRPRRGQVLMVELPDGHFPCRYDGDNACTLLVDTRTRGQGASLSLSGRHYRFGRR